MAVLTHPKVIHQMYAKTAAKEPRTAASPQLLEPKKSRGSWMPAALQLLN